MVENIFGPVIHLCVNRMQVVLIGYGNTNEICLPFPSRSSHITPKGVTIYIVFAYVCICQGSVAMENTVVLAVAFCLIMGNPPNFCFFISSLLIRSITKLTVVWRQGPKVKLL